MKPNAERFIYKQNEPLRVALGDDGKLLICLLDVCRIVGITGQTPSHVLYRLYPYQRIQRKMDNGIRALFITYPDLVSMPSKLRDVNEYKVKQLCEYVRREIISVMSGDIICSSQSKEESQPDIKRAIGSYKSMPKTYSEALRELANTTERLEAMKLELTELKMASGYVNELTNLVEKTLMLNGIRI